MGFRASTIASIWVSSFFLAVGIRGLRPVSGRLLGADLAPAGFRRGTRDHRVASVLLGLAVYSELPLLALDFRNGVQDEARGKRERCHEHERRREDGGR